jgi:hypothetical protein
MGTTIPPPVTNDKGPGESKEPEDEEEEEEEEVAEEA